MRWWPFRSIHHNAVSVVVHVTVFFLGAYPVNAEERAGIAPTHPEFPTGDARRYGAIPNTQCEEPSPERQCDTGTHGNADAGASGSTARSSSEDALGLHHGKPE